MLAFLLSPATENPTPPPDVEDDAGRGPIAWVTRRLSSLPPALIRRGAIASTLAVGMLDYFLGPDSVVTALYLVPIGLATWYGTELIGYVTSFLAAVFWVAADILSRPVPLSPGVTTWNGFVHLVGFLIVAVLLARLRESRVEQRALARLDTLTGLENTQAFLEQLEGEIYRASRYGRVFTLAYLDLDRFKEVNDTLGHAEGDEVLKRVARAMRETMRATDVTARLGGDEFGIVLPETPYAQAERALDKLRSAVLEVMRREGWPVTVSIGAVTFEISVETTREAVRMAEQLMYEVKDEGRNGIRHILWTGSMPEAS